MNRTQGIAAGSTFGSWTVVFDLDCKTVAVQCTCGTENVVSRRDLRIGATTSCGCAKKHGYKRSPEHSAWIEMRRRCRDSSRPGFKSYGGRGITVSGRWQESFLDFFADVGSRPTPRHSIDRIDVNGNYEPGNVRWATSREQQQNRTNTRRFEYDGENVSAAELARRHGIGLTTFLQRIGRGWSVERALTENTRAYHARA